MKYKLIETKKINKKIDCFEIEVDFEGSSELYKKINVSKTWKIPADIGKGAGITKEKWTDEEITERIQKFLDGNLKIQILNKLNENGLPLIQELQESLNSTDWVVTKITETQLEDEELAQELREKYSDILTKRKEQRKEINTLQGEIDELS